MSGELMLDSQLMQLARDGNLEGFESLCLERLERADLKLAELVAPLEHLEAAGQAGQFATVVTMVLENTDMQSDPAAAARIARIALAAEPRSAELRQLTVQAFRHAYAGTPGLEALLRASGLSGARPARAALSALDLCLTLKKRDVLLSRSEDVVVEVVEIDLENGLYALQREGRPITIPAAEFSSGYERLEPNDFRVLRRLRPERLGELMRDDPVALVIGMIRAQRDALDAETLKHELVPQHMPSKDWPRWWTKVRALLKRSPHVIVEGRAPVLMRYCAEAQTIEDETWAVFAGQTEPVDWLSTIDAYLREKRQRKETPDDGLLGRFRSHLVEHIAAIQRPRPSEALATALVIDRLDKQREPERRAERAAAMLRDSDNPADLIRGLTDAKFWERALTTLVAARPDYGPACAVRLMPHAPASALDRIAATGLAGGLKDSVQQHIDEALADPAHHPEVIYWLWKGPGQARQLDLPPPAELFSTLLDTLSAFGRTLAASREAMRDFRQRMRAALSLRDYGKARNCLEQIPAERAITLRRQLERLEGIGVNARARLLRMLREIRPELWVVSTKRLQPWEDPDVLWATPEGLRRKTAERDHLVNVTMRENAEYKSALEERDLLRARLARMNHDLVNARTLEMHQVPRDYVGVGSQVTLRNVHTAHQRVMTFLGPFDTDVERGVYSYLAPLAQAFMGRRLGERVTLTLDGRQTDFEITAITNSLLPDP